MKLHHIFRAAACSLLLGFMPLTASAEPPPEPGLINFTYDAAHRARLVQAMVWYPAASGGYIEEVGGNAVFKGVMARRNAHPQPARHPLILLSHGSGGNPANLGWLAGRLASSGFIVVAPAHQGTTSADSTPESTLLVWERTADMAALLDRLLESPSLGQLIDTRSITAIGFSLGGHTALALAGARSHVQEIARFCDENPEFPSCIWLDQGSAGIPGHADLHAIDEARFSARMTEPRVTRFVAVDPAFTPAYDTASLQEIAIPGMILSLGVGNDVPAAIRTEMMEPHMPGTVFERIAGANHFSFLGDCKMLGPFWVWMEGEDPICKETGDVSRASHHETIATRLIVFLKGPGI